MDAKKELAWLKKNVTRLGFSLDISPNKYIKIASEHFVAKWELIDNKIVFEVTNTKLADTMIREGWEDYWGEVDNLDRSILWVNTGTKSVVFNEN